MRSGELVYRVVEAKRKFQSRRWNRGWEGFSSCRLSSSLAAFQLSANSIDRSLAAAIAHEAQEVREARFNLLGAQWPTPKTMPPPPEFWHLDPSSGRILPSDRYCFDISFRHGIGVPEIKRIWEINRLQFLIPLAADAALRSDSAGRELVIGIILSWMKGNAPYRGINWSSGIELALRVISVTVALSIVGIDQLSDTQQARLSQFFAAHAFWIARFPSLHSSANNHLIAELAGLIAAAVTAPDILNAARLGDDSLRKLLEEITRQILPDGVGAEQAPSYSAFAIELCLVALLVAGKPVEQIPEVARDRLFAWAEMICWMMDKNGRIPAIGDCDDCRVIALTQTPELRYVASIVAAVSGFIGHPELAPPARDMHLRDIFFQSPSAPGVPPKGMRTWPMGGYTVIRGGTATPFVFMMDHGPLGYLSIAAHGHADALAIWLSVGAQQVIIDAGTYLYHSSRVWRERFRSTPLHNTLTIAGSSSSQSAGPFNWSSKANASLVTATSEPNPCLVTEHDGYLAEFGVRHRRTVQLLDDREIAVTDELSGGPVIELVAVSFLIEPSCQAYVDQADGAVLVAHHGTNLLRIASNGILRPRIYRGDEETGLGWTSPSFGLRTPADQVLFDGRLDGSSVINIRLL